MLFYDNGGHDDNGECGGYGNYPAYNSGYAGGYGGYGIMVAPIEYQRVR